MNWDNQLSSIMTATDGNVAKIRERLLMHGRHSRGKEDVYPLREMGHPVGLGPTAPTPFSRASPALSSAVQWGDLTVLQAQLHSQSQAIQLLTHNVRSLERERNAQQRQIQTLQEEVRRLWAGLEERKVLVEEDPAAMGRLDQLKREVGRELGSLRGHINKAASLGNQEESFRSKLYREEVEQFRMEVEQLRSQMMRLEEDMQQQQSAFRETRKRTARSCKTLESLAASCCTHSCDLVRTVSQTEQTHLDVRELRLTVSELKDSVRDLVLRERPPRTAAAPQKSMAAVSVETCPQRYLLLRSDSEDGFSTTPSLGDVSSDDLDPSWLGDAAPNLRSHEDAHLSLAGSYISDAGRGLCGNHGDIDGELEGPSDSSVDLSLSDL